LIITIITDGISTDNQRFMF